jgi:hypothetical protein
MFLGASYQMFFLTSQISPKKVKPKNQIIKKKRSDCGSF